MKKLVFAAALTLPLMASAAHNLVSNGSFEDGLNGWLQSSTPGTIYPVALVTYAFPGAFGEVIPTEDSGIASPDAAGASVAYFVDDATDQVLSQEFTVTAAGDYAMGFAFYLPANGFANAGEALFSVEFAGLLGFTGQPLSTLLPTTWYDSSGTAFLNPGTYNVSFMFQTQGGQSKDIVIDRVFVTAVPEPETLALMLAGLLGVGFIARRRRD
jgi:hypothetical protein